MSNDLVHFSSLDGVAERIISHLQRKHNTALVGTPGCGLTTFLKDIANGIADCGLRVNRFDARINSLSELLTELTDNRAHNASPQVVILDHVADLAPEAFQKLRAATSAASEKEGDLFLWCGCVDARSAGLCSVPSAHISFPVLSRHELLTVYKYIAAENGCRWGDAVLYLLLDLCGTDLLLVRSATDYLPGDWSDRLYDDTVWDRIGDWLKQDETVDSYRSRLASLPGYCDDTVALVRFGGKPMCKRAELIEENDDALRRLSLDGFLVPNLLPGFYQLRNLVVRFLLDESNQPELLFRRATNERAGALLQDAETMLRQVLTSVFSAIGVDAAKDRLEKIQQPGEVIDEGLNATIRKWSKDNNSDASHKTLIEILNQHRDAFRGENSAWAGAIKMMERDNVVGDESRHLHAIEYLTFNQLGALLIGLMDQAFPHLLKDFEKKQVRERWQEGIAKMGRLRNRVAHLRNVGFQDMEDLTRTLERMRRDIIDYGAWKTNVISAATEGPQSTQAAQ